MPKSAQTRIMVFGTFDILHPGHLHFFKQARRLAKDPYLIVSVARDFNVKRIKGKAPLYNERQRAAAIKQTGLADVVVLGGLKDHIPHIKKQKPDIIALGYDQKEYVDSLQDHFPKVKIVRLRSYKPSQYKSSIIKRKQYDKL